MIWISHIYDILCNIINELELQNNKLCEFFNWKHVRYVFYHIKYFTCSLTLGKGAGLREQEERPAPMKPKKSCRKWCIFKSCIAFRKFGEKIHHKWGNITFLWTLRLKITNFPEIFQIHVDFCPRGAMFWWKVS